MTNTLSFDASITLGEWLRAVYFQHKPRAFFLVLAALLAALFVVVHVAVPVVLVWFAIVTRNPAFLLPLIALALEPLHWRLLLRRGYYRNALGQTVAKIDINEQGLRIVQGNTLVSIAWPEISTWKESNESFLVIQKNKRLVVVPKRNFLSSEPVQRFRGILSARLGSTC